MPKRIKHTGKQVSMFLLHLVVFAIANLAMWYITYAGKTEWVYPWPAWVTAAWGLLVVGHACTIWANYEDRGMDTFKKQLQN
jgi:fatty acid desaturase